MKSEFGYVLGNQLKETYSVAFNRVIYSKGTYWKSCMEKAFGEFMERGKNSHGRNMFDSLYPGIFCEELGAILK